MHADEVAVDEMVVRALLAEQRPDLAHLSLRIVEPWGTDHGIWRLGPDLVVRLPRIGWATGQPERDATWLPLLAPHLPVPIPEPVHLGGPGCGYPFPWAIHRWLPGRPADPVGRGIPHADAARRGSADTALTADLAGFARDLATFTRALHAVPARGAPPARNRARPLADYDDATRSAIDGAAHLIEATAARAVWEAALAAPPHPGPPMWVHGDLEGNCLLDDRGRLGGVVDWGSACAGDPAVDVQVVWSPLFTPASRRVFLDALDVDAAALARSRGAAVHQACAALPYYLDTHPLIVARSWHKLAALGVPRRAR